MTKEYSKITFLIPTYNRPTILEDSLNHLISAGYGDFDLIVYDDGSSNQDEVERLVRGCWQNASFIRGDRCRGQAHGRNVLLAKCKTQFAICLDDDQYFDENYDFSFWLQRMSDGIVCAVALQSRDLSTGRLDQPNCVCESCKCPAFLGGSVLVDVKKLLALGGGYRSFFRYGFEEPDLAFRIYANGLEIWYEPSISVMHNHIISSISSRNENEYHLLYVRNAILLSTMNSPLVYGFARGYLRGCGQFIRKPKKAVYGLMGFFLGTLDTFRYWHKRTCFPVRVMRKWGTARREWQSLYERKI